MNDVCLHEIARALYYVKHGTWGYDPGRRRHRKWFERAEQFAVAASLTCEYVSNSDGRGSWPPRESDRPASRNVRMVGTWRRVPSPARDLTTALAPKDGRE